MAEAGEPGFEDAEEEFFPTSQVIDEQDGSLPDEGFDNANAGFDLAAQLAAARQNEKMARAEKEAALKELEDFVNMAEQLGNEKVHFQEKCAELTKANEELQEQVESLSIDKEILEHTLESLQGGGDDVIKARDENIKLRAALRQLHEVSSGEKLALQEQLQGVRAELALAMERAGLGDARAQQLEAARAEIEILKQTIDDYRGLGSLVENLTAKNLAAEERLVRLEEAEAELSDLHALTEEMDRHHLEIQRELQEDINRKTKALLKQTEVVTALQAKLAATESSLARSLAELAERRADVSSLLLRLEQREAAVEDARKGVAQDQGVRARVDELEAQGALLAARVQAAKKEAVCQAQHADRLMAFLPQESCKADCEALRCMAAVTRILAQLEVASRQVLPALISRQSAAVAGARSSSSFSGGASGDAIAGVPASLRAYLYSLTVIQERVLSAECSARDVLLLFTGCGGEHFLAAAGRHLEWEGLLTSLHLLLDKLQPDMEAAQIPSLIADFRHFAATLMAELSTATSAAQAAADAGTPSRRQSLATGTAITSPGASPARGMTSGATGDSWSGTPASKGDGSQPLRSLFHAREDGRVLSVSQLEMHVRVLEGRCQVAAELVRAGSCQMARRDSSFSWASVTAPSGADTLEDSREDSGAWLSAPQDASSLDAGLSAGWLPHLRRALALARRLKGRASRLCQDCGQGVNDADAGRVTDVTLGSMVTTSLALSEAIIADLDAAISKVKALGSSDMRARAWDHLVQVVAGPPRDASASGGGSSEGVMESMAAAGTRLSTQVDALVESIATALDHMDTAISPLSGAAGLVPPFASVATVADTSTRPGAASSAGGLVRSGSAGQRAGATKRPPWVDRAEFLLRQWSSVNQASDKGTQLAASQEATQAEIAKLAAAVAEKGRALMHASAREAQLARDVEAARADARTAAETIAGMLAELTDLRQEEEKSRLRAEQLAKAVESYKRENASFRQRIQKYAQQLQKGAMGSLGGGTATPLHDSSLVSPSSAFDEVPPSPSESVRGAKGGARNFFAGDSTSAAEVDSLRCALANAEAFVGRQLAAEIDEKLAELEASPLTPFGGPTTPLPAAASLLQASALLTNSVPGNRFMPSPPLVAQGRLAAGAPTAARLLVSGAEYRQQLEALQQVLQDLDYAQLPRLRPLGADKKPPEKPLRAVLPGTSSTEGWAQVSGAVDSVADREPEVETLLAEGGTGQVLPGLATDQSSQGGSGAALGGSASGASPSSLLGELDRVSPQHVRARRVLDQVGAWVRAKEGSMGGDGSGGGSKQGVGGRGTMGAAGFGPFAALGRSSVGASASQTSAFTRSQPSPLLCGQIRIPLLLEMSDGRPRVNGGQVAADDNGATDLQLPLKSATDIPAQTFYHARACSAKVLLPGSHGDLRRLWAASSLPVL